MILTELIEIRRQPIFTALPSDLAIGKQPGCRFTQSGLQLLLELRLLQLDGFLLLTQSQ